MVHCDSAELAERTRHLIVEAGLSLSEISRFTRVKYGSSSAYFVSDRFISTIKRGVTPHLCQIAALSEITTYSFVALMQHFGFDLRQLARLQMKLHRDRTILVAPCEWTSFGLLNRGRYLYAQIGRQDGMGFPEVVPGSIVRIDTTHPFVSRPVPGNKRQLCVVDHVQGLNCCYVTAVNEGEILLTPHHLPYRCLQYRLGDQAQILGVVDAELRPLHNIEVPDSATPNGFERNAPVPALNDPQRLSQLLRNSRERVGFRFRRAHDLSVCVASEMRNKDYAIGLGTLSDYEAADAVPRNIAKIISLCILYAIDFGRYLYSAGIAVNPSSFETLRPVNGEAGPIRVSSPDFPERHRDNAFFANCNFPSALVEAWTELLQNGTSPDSLRRYSVCAGANSDRSPETFFIVDRAASHIRESAWPAAWQRPVYLIKKRGGKYVCGFCSVSDGIMTVHHPPKLTRAIQRFSSEEADVVGQVVALARNIR